MGPCDIGAFYLNGPYSPMGRTAGAQLCWDESQRGRYEATKKPGTFVVPEVGERCQPYLLRFEDKIGLKGKTILSDQLYFELGKYSYPLPSNAIQRMGFCTLTPGETDTALSLLRKEPIGCIPTKSSEKLEIQEPLVAFKPEYGISNLSEAFNNNQFVSEAHLEASILANPKIIPEELRPDGATLCRQVPVSPFKPSQMDRADICYFSENRIRDGTIPNVLIELKKERAGKDAIQQVEKYLKWLYLILNDEASEISIYLLAPSLSCDKQSLESKYHHQVHLVGLRTDSGSQRKLFS